jgi:hypothetical protein
MNGERLVHPFSQTPRRARIEIHQFPMQIAPNVQTVIPTDEGGAGDVS